MLIDLTAPRIVYGNGTFMVDENGKLYAQNAYLSGEIHATSGTIGDFTIDESLYNDKSSLHANKKGVYIGADGIALGKLWTVDPSFEEQKSKFEVNAEGDLFANTIHSQLLSVHGTTSLGYWNFDADVMYNNTLKLSVENPDRPTITTNNNKPLYLNGDAFGVIINDTLQINGPISIGNSKTNYQIELNGKDLNLYAKFK